VSQDTITITSDEPSDTEQTQESPKSTKKPLKSTKVKHEATGAKQSKMEAASLMKVMKQVYEKELKKPNEEVDEICAFCQYVETQLRSQKDKRIRLTMQQQILNCLFQCQFGNLEAANPSTSTSTMPYDYTSHTTNPYPMQIVKNFSASTPHVPVDSKPATVTSDSTYASHYSCEPFTSYATSDDVTQKKYAPLVNSSVMVTRNKVRGSQSESESEVETVVELPFENL
jgi:hypothetical protein